VTFDALSFDVADDTLVARHDTKAETDTFTGIETYVFANVTLAHEQLLDEIGFTEPTPPPVELRDDTATLAEDGRVTIDVAANDANLADNGATVTAVGDAANGNTTRQADGTVTYTPDADWNGTDSFSYTVTAEDGTTATAGVEVTVTPVNDAPEAVADTAEVTAGETVTLDPAANDTDVDGDPLTVTKVADPAQGTAAVTADGGLTYTPDAGVSGTQTLTYTVADPAGATATGEVAVDVAPAPSPDGIVFDPAAVSQYDPNQTGDGSLSVESPTHVALEGNVWRKVPIRHEVTEATALRFEFKAAREGELQAIGVDTDDDWNTGQVPFKLHGTQSTFNQDFDTYSGGGAWQRFEIPLGDYMTGPVDQLAVINDDDRAPHDSAAAFRNVRLVERDLPNTAPSPADDSAQTVQGSAVALDVLANDTDPDGDALSLAGVGDAANGTTAIDGAGRVVYTPDAGFSGTDSFAYTLTDAAGAEARAQVRVDVAARAPDGAMTFTEADFAPYDPSQQGSGTVTVQDGGRTVRLDGNVWQKVDLDHTVTEDTVLAFDFRTEQQAELHAIGLDGDDTWSTGPAPVLLHGTQGGVFERAFAGYDGGGDWARFEIPVGALTGGDGEHLTFINDHDAGPADSWGAFRDVTLTEDAARASDLMAEYGLG
jgi:hypothetical protein